MIKLENIKLLNHSLSGYPLYLSNGINIISNAFHQDVSSILAIRSAVNYKGVFQIDDYNLLSDSQEKQSTIHVITFKSSLLVFIAVYLLDQEDTEFKKRLNRLILKTKELKEDTDDLINIKMESAFENALIFKPSYLMFDFYNNENQRNRTKIEACIRKHEKETVFVLLDNVKEEVIVPYTIPEKPLITNKEVIKIDPKLIEQENEDHELTLLEEDALEEKKRKALRETSSLLDTIYDEASIGGLSKIRTSKLPSDKQDVNFRTLLQFFKKTNAMFIFNLLFALLQFFSTFLAGYSIVNPDNSFFAVFSILFAILFFVMTFSSCYSIYKEDTTIFTRHDGDIVKGLSSSISILVGSLLSVLIIYIFSRADILFKSTKLDSIFFIISFVITCLEIMCAVLMKYLVLPIGKVISFLKNSLFHDKQ